MSETTEEKSLPPSTKKLRDARRKGQIASSREFVGAVSTTAALGYVAIRTAPLLKEIEAMIEYAGRLSTEPWQEALPALYHRIAWMAFGFIGPLVGFVLLCVVAASVLGNGGFAVSAQPLLPKMDRLDPVAGFGRIFSLRNLTDSLKTLVKLVVVGTTTLVLTHSAVGPLTELPACGMTCVPGVVRALFGPLLVAAIILFLVLGGLDLALQRFLFRHEMRMTRTEQKRERKDSQGNPLIKRAHKQEQRAAMQNRVRTGVRNATFVIRAEDLAVAFRYGPPDVLVPVLVARAIQEAASALVEEAGRAGIPCVLNSEVATLLSSKMQVGGLLPKELFNPVIACMREAGVL